MDSNDLAAHASLQTGKVLLGDYVLGTVKESCALWTAYLGWDTRQGDRPVQVIALRSDVLPEGVARAASDSWDTMFESLRHPGLAPVLASGLDGDVFYVITAEVVGPTLQERIAAAPDGRLTVAETARIVRQIADPLSWLHTRPAPIVHEALDPRVVAFTGSALDVCLTNAGLVHALRQAGLARVERPVPYSAPEQFEEESPVGPAADQFALASLAFECLTGTRAHGSDAEAAQAILSGHRPPLPSDIGDRRSGLTRSLHRAWSRHPEVRYPSVAAFVADFTRSAGAESAVPESSPVRTMRSGTLIGLQSPPDRAGEPPPPPRSEEFAPGPPLVADRPVVTTAPTAPAAIAAAPPIAPPRMAPPPPPPSAFTVPTSPPAPPIAVAPPPRPLAPPAFAPPPPPRQPPIQPAQPAFQSAVPTRSPEPAKPQSAAARPSSLRVGGLIALAAVLVIGGSMALRSMLHPTPAPGPSALATVAPPTVSSPSVPTRAPAPAAYAPTPAPPSVPTRHGSEPGHAPPQLPPTPVAPSAPPMAVPSQPVAAAPEPAAHPSVGEVRDALQRGVEDCAARNRRYGRHVFVGIAYDRPNGEPIAVGIAGAPILPSMRRCIQEVAGTTRSPQSVNGRWQHSFYLHIP